MSLSRDLCLEKRHKNMSPACNTASSSSPFPVLPTSTVLMLLFISAALPDTIEAGEYTINAVTELPTFMTSSQVFKVVEHETVVLPCEVTHSGQYVLAWKRGIAVLSAGSVKVTPEPRYRLVNGYSLEIRDAQAGDAGDYVCQIGTLEPSEITHTLEILVPPRINYITSNGKVEAKKGGSVLLECRASGNPPPQITWTRRNNVLPSGEQSRKSPTLQLSKVDRHQAGTYHCVATNGVGQSASQSIVLHVLYPPEIQVERPLVFSGEGLEAHLVCIVYGESPPEVLWYRDTMQLDTTERRIMESRGSRHTLIIRQVHASDFGNYTCVADNQLGKARKVVQLTGKPNPAEFVSSTLGQWRDRYNISWNVVSHAPLEEVKLLYRKLPDQPEHEQLQPLVSHEHTRRTSSKDISIDQMAPSHVGVGGIVYGSGLGFGTYRNRGEWRDVMIPATRNRRLPNSYMIKGLEPQTLYEARLQTKNRFGWSPVSQSFTFQTTNTGNNADMPLPSQHGPAQQPNVYDSDNVMEVLRAYNNVNKDVAEQSSVCNVILTTILFIVVYAIK